MCTPEQLRQAAAPVAEPRMSRIEWLLLAVDAGLLLGLIAGWLLP